MIPIRIFTVELIMTKKILLSVLVFAGAIQLIRPDFNHLPVDEKATLKTSPEVMGILKTSCYDCHSGETKYPWYGNIAPVSWVMADHIKRGRSALDFSNWENMDPSVKLLRMERAKQVIESELMPKPEYTVGHKDAMLTPEQKKALQAFFDEQIRMLDDTNRTQSNLSHDYSTL